MGISRFTGLFLLAAVAWGASAQPMARDRKTVGDVEIYPDFKDRKVWYFAPGKLSLAAGPDGKPQFQLLEMRYTGTAATGNSGEKRFMNVVQFTVGMEQLTGEAMSALKKELGNGVDLRPIPIQSIEAILVAPVSGASGGAYTRIGATGSFQAGVHEARGTGYWTERTFTVKLENHEAQLVWDQVAAGQLALSLSYAFYAHVVPGTKGDVQTSGAGASDVVDDDMLAADTVAVPHIIRADAFPVRVDVAKWPDLIRKIDLNEGVPPAYAALEVRCYDFTNDLRPDLAIKSVEIRATGVSGAMVTLPAKKFMRSKPDINAFQVQFPYAVKLTEPFSYRIVEYTLEGNREEGDWITRDAWVGILDITTDEVARRFERRSIEVEVPQLDAGVIVKAVAVLHYDYRGHPATQQLEFLPADELPLRQATFMMDKGSDLECEVTWHFVDGTAQTIRTSEPATDDYIYLANPGK